MDADTHGFSKVVSAFIFIFLWLITACAPTSTPTPFRPPTKSGPTAILSTTTPVPQLFIPTFESSPTPTIPTAIPPCTDNLTFVNDATVPDGTIISPGASIDKQWIVSNSGSCNWDARYRLKWIGGDTLGAAEQALFPARAGTQATLRVIFIAPNEIGNYESAWQAYGPDGAAFGDPVYVKIVVE